MKTALLILTASLVTLSAATSTMAQEAKKGLLGATFPQAYQPTEGPSGDLRLILGGGGSSDGTLQVVADGAVVRAAGQCPVHCEPEGQRPPDFCYTECPGGDGVPVIPVVLRAKPIELRQSLAFKFETQGVRLIDDPQEVARIKSSGAQSE